MSPAESQQAPRTNLKGLKDHWRNDLIAGFSVALVALPLAMGIATAAGAPPISGLMSSILAGLLATFIRGSHVAINGPGNSLVVIIAGAFSAFGGGAEVFPHVLGAVAVAGGVQVLFGLLRLGKLGDIVPPAVVQGLLAAIGLIIIGKQAHVLFGQQSSADSPIAVYQQLPESVMGLNVAATIIGVVSLIILTFHRRFDAKLIHFIPAPLWVVIFAIPLAMLFEYQAQSVSNIIGLSVGLQSDMFVSIPEDPLGSLVFPDFSRIGESGFWFVVLTLCLVTSIENIVSVKAVDKLDLYRRRSSLDRDLVAMGLTSVVCAFVGALPALTVIARSSVNVNHGAKTGWSNFFHGAILLLFVLLFRPVIQEIALAALAGILIYTGYKLASPAVVKDTLVKGPDQFIIFGITVVATLVWGLLWGLAIGIAAELIGHALVLGLPPREAFRRLWGTRIERIDRIDDDDDDHVVLRLRGIANFLTVPRIRRVLADLPDEANVVVDFGPAMLVDNTVLEYVHDFARRRARDDEESFEVIGLEAHRALSDHPYTLHAQERKLHVRRLTPRQQHLKEWAENHRWSFDARRNWDPGHLEDFQFFRIHRIEFRDTFVHGAVEADGGDIDFTICDVTFEQGAIIGQIYHTTTEVLYLPFNLPEFVLERKGILHRALAFAGFRDIDFKHFTRFSNRFVLKGSKERAIRDLMSSEILEFFESEEVYYVESTGHALVIFRTFVRRATVGEVEAMVDFSKRLMKLLVKRVESSSTLTSGKAPVETEWDPSESGSAPVTGKGAVGGGVDQPDRGSR